MSATTEGHFRTLNIIIIIAELLLFIIIIIEEKKQDFRSQCME